jgi:hypothetical protein
MIITCTDNFISLTTKPKISALLPLNDAKCRIIGRCEHTYYNNTPKANSTNVIFQILTAVMLKIKVLWEVKLHHGLIDL